MVESEVLSVEGVQAGPASAGNPVDRRSSLRTSAPTPGGDPQQELRSSAPGTGYHPAGPCSSARAARLVHWISILRIAPGGACGGALAQTAQTNSRNGCPTGNRSLVGAGSTPLVGMRLPGPGGRPPHGRLRGAAAVGAAVPPEQPCRSASPKPAGQGASRCPAIPCQVLVLSGGCTWGGRRCWAIRL